MSHFICGKTDLREGDAQKKGPEVGGYWQEQKSQSPWNCVSEREEGHGKDASMWRSGRVSHEQYFKCDGKPLGVFNKGGNPI